MYAQLSQYLVWFVRMLKMLCVIGHQGRIHPRQSANPHYGQTRHSSEPRSMSLDCGRKPTKHRENMQTHMYTVSGSKDTTASARISECLVDISSWMMAHQLKLNPSKTELLVIPGDPSPAQDLISLNNSMISPSATARNLGVTMDNQLSFSSHVTNVTRSCQFLLYNIRRIRPFLSTQATQVLVQSLVISRLDYCNSLLAGLPLNAIRPLQMIQNEAARLVFNQPKFSHTTPLLRSLHWLPVAACIRFKTLMLAYKAKNGPAPSYLKALVTPRTAPRSLRSASTARLVPPSLREKDSNPITEIRQELRGATIHTATTHCLQGSTCLQYCLICGPASSSCGLFCSTFFRGVLTGKPVALTPIFAGDRIPPFPTTGHHHSTVILH
ncbi:hypothetical protein QTP86_000157 [Hemibagrus guttatus]|nr:hypothetical protein QTP86_000157 [Hemibagrus guttatus]